MNRTQAWQKKQLPEGQYYGQVKEGQPHGQGQLDYDKSHPTLGQHLDRPQQYRGEFKRGEPHGVGEYQFRNGDHYSGQVKGVPHGKGHITFGREWKDQSLEDGEGAEIFPEAGDQLHGHFTDGKIKSGTLQNPAGETLPVKG